MKLVLLTEFTEIAPQRFGIFLVASLAPCVTCIRCPAGIHAELGTSYIPDGTFPYVKETSLLVADHFAQTADLIGYKRVHRIQNQCSDRPASFP